MGINQNSLIDSETETIWRREITRDTHWGRLKVRGFCLLK